MLPPLRDGLVQTVANAPHELSAEICLTAEVFYPC
jgi:hypothetical protein